MAHVLLSNGYYVDTNTGQLNVKLSDGSYKQLTADLNNPYYGKYFRGNAESIFQGYRYSPQQKKFIQAHYTKLNGVTFGDGDTYYDNGRKKNANGTITNYTITPELQRLFDARATASTVSNTAQSTNQSSTTNQSVENANTTQTDPNDNNNPTSYKGYFAANELGQYQSLAARRKWIADNAEWLKGQGFNSATYNGSTEANKRLVQLIKKKQAETANSATTRQTTVANPVVATQQSAVTPTPKTYTAQQLLGMSEADAAAAGAKDAWAQVQADKLYYDDYNTERSEYTPNAQYSAGWDVTRAAMQGYGQDALTRGRFRQSYNNYMQNIDNFSSDEKMRNYLRSLSPAERLRQKRIHENMGIYQQNVDKYTNASMTGKDAPTWDPNKVYTISQKNGGRINYFKYFE